MGKPDIHRVQHTQDQSQNGGIDISDPFRQKCDHGPDQRAVGQFFQRRLKPHLRRKPGQVVSHHAGCQERQHRSIEKESRVFHPDRRQYRKARIGTYCKNLQISFQNPVFGLLFRLGQLLRLHQFRNRDFKNPRQLHQISGRWLRLPRFPFGNRLPADPQLLCQVFLREFSTGSQLSDIIANPHTAHRPFGFILSANGGRSQATICQSLVAWLLFCRKVRYILDFDKTDPLY